MKTGVNLNCFSRENGYLYYAEQARRAGFDVIEMATGLEGELNLFSPEQDFVQFRRDLEGTGVQCLSTCSRIFSRFPLTASDGRKREQSMDLVRRQLLAAAALGCSGTLITIGAVTEEMDYRTAYELALETVSSLAADAKNYGVKLCVENVWNQFLLSPLETLRFLETIGSPFVGAYFDTGNAVKNGYPEQWIRILGSRVFKVHIKDFRRAVGTAEGFTRIGMGDVNFPAVMNALKETGYQDTLIAELENTDPARSPQELMREAKADMDQALQSQEEQL